MRRILVISLLVLVAAVSASAQVPSRELGPVLLAAGSAAELRALLRERALAAVASDPIAAGEAFYFLGASFERSALRDSAIAAYRRALELRGLHEDRIALVDALLLRRASGDLTEALDALRAAEMEASLGGPGLQIAYLGRHAWAHVLAGHADTAVALFTPLVRNLGEKPKWRFRIGRAYLEAGDPRKAYDLLLPIAVMSRGADEEVMQMLRQAAEQLQVAHRLDWVLEGKIADVDAIEHQVLDTKGGSRGQFYGRDGFRLGGIAIVPPSEQPRRAAVVLMAPGDPVADYDSLSVALTRAGFSVMLMDVRGSGWSVAPICPLPDTWEGREAPLHTRVAQDAHAALNALAEIAAVDTSHYLLVGVGPTASMAVEAAEHDRRVAALLLLSPRPAVVDRGPMRARLERLQLPAFFQTGPEDFETLPLVEAFYQAGDRRSSRVVEARVMARGALQFRGDPAVSERFIQWLRDALPGVPRDARPATRRTG